ncbi:MAG: hypothetical protein SCH10_00555 [Nitrosomonadaceae bacterium]|nr:hypothetical protein [Nitrosomonadaceae bacterium]
MLYWSNRTSPKGAIQIAPQDDGQNPERRRPLIITELKWLINANDLWEMPPPPISLDAVLDVVITYSPDYMHGIPKKKYVHFLKQAIEQQKAG